MTQDLRPGDAAPEPIATPLGRYTHDVRTDTWWWSAELFTLFGFTPDTIEPGPEIALSRVHPDDRETAAEVMAHQVSAGEPYVYFLRIIDLSGRERHVLACGHGEFDENGDLTGHRGYLLDLTSHQREAARLEVDEAIARVTERRAEIEQAKGALMSQYRIDADEAFSVLSAYSQRTNRKLRDVAREIVEVAGGRGRTGPLAANRLDVLLTSIARFDSMPDPQS